MRKDASKRGRYPVTWVGPLAVVTLPSEIDVGNQREVDDELSAVLSMWPDPLIADMTRTRFCDSSGYAALLRAGQRADVLQLRLRISAPGVPILRVMRILGADRLLDIYPNLDSAIAGGDPGGRPGPGGSP